MTNANNNAHSRPRNFHLSLSVNGEEISVSVAPYKTLLEVLREDLLLTGTKHGCELGECGACTVLVDGQPLMSCLVLALECEDRKIETVEGMTSKSKLHPLQLAFAEHGGSQCGYCTGGMLMSARAFLESQPRPDRQQIREALSGNLCRCTGYQQIIDSVEAAAATMRDGGILSAGDKP
jgi:aerobic-type carbon monoxide dehydrogenase small subunit (CoxS/CutS family)